MNETNNQVLTTTGTSTINGHSASAIRTNLNSGYLGTPINIVSDDYAVTNSKSMRTKQVKAAVFTIERNDKNEVTSSKFVKELWVEVKNGASLELVVAKELDKDFDPANTIIREINSFSF